MSFIQWIKTSAAPYLLSGLVSIVSGSGCTFQQGKECIEGTVCDAGPKSDAADANYSGTDTRPSGYDAAHQQPVDSGQQPQDDAQPHPECRVDLECPEPQKCIEEKCVTDEYDAQPHPECRIDLECPEPLKCIEEMCITDGYDAGQPARDSGQPPLPNDAGHDAEQPLIDTDGDDVIDANDPDDDNDLRIDAEDNCPLVPNQNQSDIDGDGIGDVCDQEDNRQLHCREGILFSPAPANDFSTDISLLTPQGNIEAIIATDSNDHGSSWSPDGTAFAFIRTGLLEVHYFGRDTELLMAAGALTFNAAWSPDGTRIAYTGGRIRQTHIYSIHPDGGGNECVTCELPNVFMHPAWMPDNKLTAVRINEPIRGLFGTLVLIEEGQVQELSDATMKIFGTAWRDEHTVAVSGYHLENNRDISGLYLCRNPFEVACGSGGRYTVLDSGGLSYSKPSWSPDGTSLVYAKESIVNDTRRMSIFRIDGVVDEQERRTTEILNGPWNNEPAFSPGCPQP